MKRLKNSEKLELSSKKGKMSKRCQDKYVSVSFKKYAKRFKQRRTSLKMSATYSSRTNYGYEGASAWW